MIGWMTVSDILRITTPLISRNATQVQPRQPAPGEIFTLDQTLRVLKANPQSEMLMQNNALVEKDSSIPEYVNLLTNPDVVSGYMSSILLLEEIIGLLPLNSKTVTPEIQEMFDALFITSEDIVPELIRQEKASTTFKGDFYNFIRTVLEQDDRPETLYTALRLVKYYDESNLSRNALKSVSNYLKYLSELLSPSKEISARLKEVSERILDEAPDQSRLFSIFNTEVVPLLHDIKSSILFDERIERLLSMVVYNLSRCNHNTDALPQLGEEFAEQLESDSLKYEFLALLKSAISVGQDGSIQDSTLPVDSSQPSDESLNSKVMEALTRLIKPESKLEGLPEKAKGKLNNIISGLLSSPSSFTPLLHYILPIEYENIRAYAEIWISPNSVEEDELAGEKPSPPSSHFLIVFGVDGIGMFEAELFVRGHTIDFLLLCPEEYTNVFASLKSTFRDSIRNTEYRFGDVRIDKLESRRSIVEVFTSLPYRRMGIDLLI